MFNQGLTQASLPELEALLRKLHRKELALPITHQSLVTSGLPGLIDKVTFLHGMPEEAAKAVLVAVIAERRVRQGRPPAPIVES
jgi:hypothetical protein